MTQAPTPGPLTSESVKLLVKGDLLWYAPESGRAELVWLRRNHKDVLAAQSVRDPDCGHGDDHARFTFIGRPDESGWMPWSGGENPVPGQRVERKQRSGDLVWCACLSDDLRWSHSGWDTDIIAFRLAPTAPVEASGSEQLWPVGSWLSAALDDPKVCDAMKSDIRDWFDNGGHLRPQPSGETREQVARVEAMLPAIERIFPVHVTETPDYAELAFHECAAQAMTMEPDTWTALNTLATDLRALLSARPLALGGQQGEVEEALSCLADYDHTGRLEQAVRAALSTNPARAEAQDEDTPCTDCGDTGVTHQTERRCSCQEAEAQDEGAAGEEVMRAAGYTVGLISTLGNPVGTWGFTTSLFRDTTKGFRTEQEAWTAAATAFEWEKKRAREFLSSISAHPSPPPEPPYSGRRSREVR